MLLDGLFKRSPSGTTSMQVFSGSAPIYGQYGQNIFSYDIVNVCISAIADEMSKLSPRHIRRDPETGKLVKPSNDNINRLFKRPNPLMTMKDFIEKTIWTLYLNSNVFIYPTYDILIDSRGNKSRYYTGLWPLNPTQVNFLEDAAGYIFVKFTFSGGKETTLPYSDIIHLRKKYSVNDLMGGSLTGNVDNTALLKVLNVNDTILTGTAASITLSQGIKGILKLNTVVDVEKKDAERAAFVKSIQNGEGVIVQDFKGEFTPVDLSTKTTDSETLKYVENKVFRWFGVSTPILDGDFTEAQYQSFYEKTLEPIILSLNQAFTNIMFSPTEIGHGNEIVFYYKDLLYLSVASKLELIQIAGDQGLLTINQKLDILGYPPIDGGDIRTMSLNYISSEIADVYQMNRSINGNKDNNDGGGNNAKAKK